MGLNFESVIQISSKKTPLLILKKKIEFRSLKLDHKDVKLRANDNEISLTKVKRELFQRIFQ